MLHASSLRSLTLLFAACLACLTLALGGCEKSAAGDSANVLHFTVEGMHCTGCEGTVRSEMSKLDGVRSCTVSFENGTADVEVDDPAVAQAIIERLGSLEYTLTLQPADAPRQGAPNGEAAEDHAADDPDEADEADEAGERE